MKVVSIPLHIRNLSSYCKQSERTTLSRATWWTMLFHYFKKCLKPKKTAGHENIYLQKLSNLLNIANALLRWIFRCVNTVVYRKSVMETLFHFIRHQT